ncbi:MAG TPA: cytochrome P450, partial [Pyrinomonadaceae bacterium]|nr:cytochrome P450 [Pyrinomonadaceae bacterium]
PVLCAWMKQLTENRQSKNIILNFLVKKILLVSGHNLSRHILSQKPCAESYLEGRMKKKAMSFLAPEALTICHGEKWERLRSFNENVLCAGEPHVYRQAFLERVRDVFSSPVTDIEDIRRRMGRVMLDIVFGAEAKAPGHLSKDVQVLFGLVQSPVKRLFLGFKEKKRREKFYENRRELWKSAAESKQPSLLARAHEFAGENDEDELIQQIPHWMFTFTGSASDLLTRTLALLTAREESRARVLSEIASTGSLDEASTIDRLDYLDACFSESARLFSPVPLTFHCAPQGDNFEGAQIPAQMEILHYFPLNQRDSARDSTADSFLPERWLKEDSTAFSDYPNLFLSGKRACPGRELILFVCKSALATLLEKKNLQIESDKISTDPLPFSLDEEKLRFRANVGHSENVLSEKER